ncbi:hypothetical protein AB0M39_02240 [Streptomyces sp. NPDC051907]|uniref:hypothetical protein n=1 Tax=Streptomyces sp. NPDC051907 TaxID=3155284 RepID=UPI003427CF02
MSAPIAATPSLPDIARLRPRQQMAMECARCARYLGPNGEVLCDVRHQGLLFRLWICGPACRSPTPGLRTGVES